MSNTLEKLSRWMLTEIQSAICFSALLGLLLVCGRPVQCQVAGPEEPESAESTSGDTVEPKRGSAPVPNETSTRTEAGGRASDSLTETLYVTVSVNGNTVADFMQVVRNARGKYFAPPECFTAARLGIPNASVLSLAGRSFLPLDAVEGLSYKFNEGQQSLDLAVPAAQFELSHINARPRTAYTPTAPSPGFFLNHDFQFLGIGRNVQAAGSFEAVGFGFGGVVSNSLIVGDMTSSHSVHRLNSQFVREFPQRMRVLTLGDSLSRGGSWTRQLHFLGVEWASNFAIQPSFVPFALPGVQGQAAEPSTLDLYVNNVRTMNRPVNAGPFTIDNIPIITSQGDIQMVLTDALGRQQVVTTSYISNPTLLRAGVHDFNYQAGLLRWGIGTALDSYHTLFASGGHRFGVTDRFTVGADGEAAGTSQSVGAAGYWGVFPVGILSGGVGISHSAFGIGTLSHAELSHRTPKFGLGGRVQFATKSFRQLGLGEIGSPRIQIQTQASYSFHSRATAGLAYVQQAYYRSPFASTSAFRTVSGSLNFRVGHLGYLSWTTNYTPAAKERVSAYMTLTVPLGLRRSAMLSSSYNGGNVSGTAMLSKSLPLGDGIGYRARYSSDNSSVDAGFDKQNRWGTYTVEAGKNRTDTSYRLQERGSLAFVQDRIIPTRWLNDSFALVDLTGIKGVRVYANNQYVTKTDRRGLALVPMVPYDANSVRLDDQGVPVEMNMDLNERVVVPMTRSGVLVRFEASQNRGMIIVVRLPDGAPVPAGAEVRVEPMGSTTTAGYDGEVYVENLVLPASLVLHWDGKQCRTDIPPTTTGHPLSRIGPLTCARQ